MILAESTIDELKEFFRSVNEPEYRAYQTFQRIHKHLANHIDEFTELPKKLRNLIFEKNLLPQIQMTYSEMVSENSEDKGTEKFIFEYKGEKESQNRTFESVWIVSEKRRTACISSQSGCSLHCIFCATGKLPFKGNLKTWQILQQVYYMIRYRKERLTNVVFMGMGEPFYNYENVIKAAQFLNHKEGLNIGARHITISTAGVVPFIERFIAEKQPFNLAISLNHPINEKRNELMDINLKYPLKDLIQVVKKYIKVYKKNITFEYILIPEKNMDQESLNTLIQLAKEIKHCKLNLIPLNTNFENLRSPTEKEVLEFQNELRKNNILAFYRGSPGKKINAACGMLALKKREELPFIHK